MKRGLAVTLAPFALLSVLLSGFGAANAQAPGVCNGFQPLSEEARKQGEAVSAAIKAKADPKKLCALMSSFVVAEGKVVKFLDDNKTWCGVPEEALKASKANHEKSVEFRTRVCSNDQPRAKAPTLSDAIKTPSVDTSTNTKTGPGTFDTLMGNPLAR